jgi:hypothetical protein
MMSPRRAFAQCRLGGFVGMQYRGRGETWRLRSSGLPAVLILGHSLLPLGENMVALGK